MSTATQSHQKARFYFNVVSVRSNRDTYSKLLDLENRIFYPQTVESRLRADENRPFWQILNNFLPLV